MAFVVSSAYLTYSTLDCLNLNGAPALFVLRQYLEKKKKKKNTSFSAGVIALRLYLLFNPILLYLLPKLKRYSGRKPPRPVYVKALYLQQQRPFYCRRNCGFCCKQCLSVIQPILQSKTVAVDQPHPTCLY